MEHSGWYRRRCPSTPRRVVLNECAVVTPGRSAAFCRRSVTPHPGGPRTRGERPVATANGWNCTARCASFPALAGVRHASGSGRIEPKVRPVSASGGHRRCRGVMLHSRPGQTRATTFSQFGLQVGVPELTVPRGSTFWDTDSVSRHNRCLHRHPRRLPPSRRGGGSR
jgi:hypothetical protein